ncbi:hypothetical protein M0804_014567 [Polistes exclamans]|nr:hypothetical protein M0804_014574 [Polistes exclamans]KAI4474973.1 hypothetical protein M0804_014567 [Polistes exclamans]
MQRLIRSKEGTGTHHHHNHHHHHHHQPPPPAAAAEAAAAEAAAAVFPPPYYHYHHYHRKSTTTGKFQSTEQHTLCGQEKDNTGKREVALKENLIGCFHLETIARLLSQTLDIKLA